MKKEMALVAATARDKAMQAISLFTASVRRYRSFDSKRRYTPK